MYRARVGHTRIDDAEGNVGKRQGRRIIGHLRVHRTFNASINFISFFFVTSFSDNYKQLYIHREIVFSTIEMYL